jgi:hypothetical protein
VANGQVLGAHGREHLDLPRFTNHHGQVEKRFGRKRNAKPNQQKIGIMLSWIGSATNLSTDLVFSFVISLRSYVSIHAFVCSLYIRKFNSSHFTQQCGIVGLWPVPCLFSNVGVHQAMIRGCLYDQQVVLSAIFFLLY